MDINTLCFLIGIPIIMILEACFFMKLLKNYDAFRSIQYYQLCCKLSTAYHWSTLDDIHPTTYQEKSKRIDDWLLECVEYTKSDDSIEHFIPMMDGDTYEAIEDASYCLEQIPMIKKEIIDQIYTTSKNAKYITEDLAYHQGLNDALQILNKHMKEIEE